MLKTINITVTGYYKYLTKMLQKCEMQELLPEQGNKGYRYSIHTSSDKI